MILLRYLFVVLLTGSCINAGADGPFEAGFAKLHSRITTDPSPTNVWSPHLRLLVGVDATEGTKQTICFVELTTIKPPATNTNGKPWAPVFETNGFSWTVDESVSHHHKRKIRLGFVSGASAGV